MALQVNNLLFYSTQINAIGNEMPRAGKLHIYGYCLARHNGTFHRAQVLNILGKNDFKLLLVDQGTVKLRNRSDLREINQELLSLPCYSKVVQLKDVPYAVFTDSVAKFLSQFEGEKFVGIYKKSPGHISLDLVHPITKQSLNAQIREFYSNRQDAENQSKEPTLAQPTTEIFAKLDDIPQCSNKEPPKQPSVPIESAKNEVHTKALPPSQAFCLPASEIQPLGVSEGTPVPLESKINRNLDLSDIPGPNPTPEQSTNLKDSIINPVEAGSSKPSNMPKPIETVTKEAIAYSVDALKSMIPNLEKKGLSSTTKKEAILRNIINFPKESSNYQKDLVKTTDSQKHSTEKTFPSKEFFENILSLEKDRKAEETSLFSVSLKNTLDATGDDSTDPFMTKLDEIIKDTLKNVELKSKETTPQTDQSLRKSTEANGTTVSKLEPLLTPV